MTLTFKKVRHPGEPVIYIAQVNSTDIHSYEIEPDGDRWSVNVLRPRQQLMGPLHANVFAGDMRFSALRFRTLQGAKAACEMHMAGSFQ